MPDLGDMTVVVLGIIDANIQILTGSHEGLSGGRCSCM
jgi:hypothetical protein